MKNNIGKTKRKTKNLLRRIELLLEKKRFNKKSTAAEYNKDFVYIGPKAAFKIQNLIDISFGSLNTSSRFRSKKLANYELHKTFLFLKSSRLAGYDEISPNIVKTVFNEVFSTIRN